MSEQLTLGDILDLAKELKAAGMTNKEIRNLPVYIGDDDELNGIHCAWYRQLIDENNEDDAYSIIEMINENRNNIEFDKQAILIS